MYLQKHSLAIIFNGEEEKKSSVPAV